MNSMKKQSFNRYLLPIILLLFSSGSSASSFAALTGNQNSVDDYTGKGKWVVLMIWASDCHICNRESQSYVEFHEKYKNDNAVVVGLSMDGKAGTSDALEFLDRNKVSFDSLIGEPEQVASFYSEKVGIPWAGTPTFMIYAPDGSLAAQQVGAVPTELLENFINSQSGNTAE